MVVVVLMCDGRIFLVGFVIFSLFCWMSLSKVCVCVANA